MFQNLSILNFSFICKIQPDCKVQTPKFSTKSEYIVPTVVSTGSSKRLVAQSANAAVNGYDVERTIILLSGHDLHTGQKWENRELFQVFK